MPQIFDKMSQKYDKMSQKMWQNFIKLWQNVTKIGQKKLPEFQKVSHFLQGKQRVSLQQVAWCLFNI